MTEKKTLLAALILTLSLALASAPAVAAGEEPAHAEQQDWTFAGVFGTYDRNQLRRGFQIFQQSCSSCHGLEYIAFRNLSEPGGPQYSEEQVRALAEQYTIADPDAEGGEREGIPADRWPDPFPSDQIARDANGGALPPDLSLMAKARSIHLEFPWWIFTYFTAYQEGGADYIYNLLVNYHEAPEGVEMQPGQYYNSFFSGHSIAMPPPLADGMIDYEGEGTPETVEQYARDVAAFLQWTADPHMVHRKELGFRVILFLIGFAVLMYLVKRRIWRDAH
ncbi:cytochrome c1 [Pelagibacterium xiamenense]|uniref:cytochrome c1 n=1 Tax=Pelagibacterium xiamenense TaxID=2901140 RepID=UPI001E5D27FD|nr:cytochrome c1 [Pelagibacterium xiamenense]MCD7060317.1 cytochrome c1 [Pelagibacterium xiamenense]